MKKVLIIFSLLFTSFLFLPTSDLQAQTSNPWNGPRWASVKVSQTLTQWLIANDLLPNEDGEWMDQDWSYEGQAVWKIIASWGDEKGTLGTRTFYIKNNGTILKEE